MRYIRVSWIYSLFQTEQLPRDLGVEAYANFNSGKTEGCPASLMTIDLPAVGSGSSLPGIVIVDSLFQALWFANALAERSYFVDFSRNEQVFPPSHNESLSSRGTAHLRKNKRIVALCLRLSISWSLPVVIAAVYHFGYPNETVFTRN